jgi:mannose-1-phosphate guanylyltransferase
MSKLNNHVVIMAGGSGQRFWPWSTQALPKQFHDFLGTGRTLLQATAERFIKVVPKSHIWVVTQDMYKHIVQAQLPWIDEQQILCEPIARDTAACIAYACYKISSNKPEATLIITPADHHIQHEGIFVKLLQQALQLGKSSLSITLLGVPCKNVETGYGYISYNKEEDGFIKSVTHFVEKPPHQQAVTLIEQGNYVWNTGIFIGKLDSFIKSFQTYRPTLWAAFQQANLSLDADRERSLINLYDSLPAISFDHAVLERADCLYVICQDFGWSDLGTWNTLYEYSNKDTKGNVCQGQVVTLSTNNCLIKGNGKQLIATYGLDNVVIIQHRDTLVICPRSEVQNLKKLVQQIEDEGYAQYL